MKLAPKLTLLFLLIAIVPLIIVGVATYENSREAIMRQTTHHLIATNILKEAELKRWIEDGKQDFERLAGRPYFKDSFAGVMQAHSSTDLAHEKDHRQITEDYLLPYVTTGGFLEVFILRPGDGLILISTDAAQEGKYRESELYLVEGRKETYVQNVTYSQSLEQAVMTMATPIRDRQGELIAVLGGRLDLGELTRIMEQGRGLTETEDTYLVNKFNFFVTEPRFGKNFALKRTVQTEGVNAALRGSDGIGLYLDYRGVPVIGAFKWLPEHALCLITEMDQSEAFAPIVRMRWVVLGIALAVAGATALMAFRFARTITRPVRELVAGTEEIGRGNLDYQVGTSAGDEIGALSRAFDRMTVELKTTTVSRDELARERDFSDSVINSLPGLFYLIDKEGRFVRWNRNLELVTGFPTAEISGMSLLDFFSHEEQQLTLQRIDQAFIEGEASVEANLQTRHGRSIPFYLTGLRVRIGDRDLLAGVGIDIRARKQAEKELHRLNKDLVRSNEELEQFAYVASHDLQEPLRMVSSYTQLLAQRYGDKLDEDAADFIRFAVDGANRMQRLIQDLLTYSRVTTRGKIPEPVEAREALEDALANLQGLIGDTGATLSIAELPRVLADRAQLVQLFQNLIGNALKFHKPVEPPQVAVRATLGAATGGVPKGNEQLPQWWTFSVTDNGIGIDPKYFERLFVIFQRLHSSDQYPGTGIGLALCKRIVERHGGAIWIESEPGKGATFTFTLTGA